MTEIREAFFEGLCDGLRQWRTVPRRYFDPLIGLVGWMYRVAKHDDRKNLLK